MSQPAVTLEGGTTDRVQEKTKERFAIDERRKRGLLWILSLIVALQGPFQGEDLSESLRNALDSGPQQ